MIKTKDGNVYLKSICLPWSLDRVYDQLKKTHILYNKTYDRKEITRLMKSKGMLYIDLYARRYNATEMSEQTIRNVLEKFVVSCMINSEYLKELLDTPRS